MPVTPGADELAEVALFAGLSRASLDALCPEVDVLELPSDVEVCAQRAVGRQLWVVLAGALDASRRGSSGRAAGTRAFRAGEWFGEMALLDLQGQPWTVRTKGPVRLARIRASTLDALYRRDLKSYALIWMNAARELSRQLRASFEKSPRRRRTPPNSVRGHLG